MLATAAVWVLGCGDDASKIGDDGDAGTDDAGDGGDTDTGEDCGPQVITDENTGLVWRRCHDGGWWEWSPSFSKCKCVDGLVNTMAWDMIFGACDPSFRPATVDELMGVLENCDDWLEIEANGSGSCDGCQESEPCQTLFPNDGRFYWSATEANEVEAWHVAFNVGTVNSVTKGADYYVRCIEE
jgi:hypothetical protein